MTHTHTHGHITTAPNMTQSDHADIVRCKSYARSHCVFVRLIKRRVELRGLLERDGVCALVYVSVGWGGVGTLANLV